MAFKELVKVRYNGVDPGEKVLFMGTSSGWTSNNYGTYLGVLNGVPVVETHEVERKWRWNSDENRYIEDSEDTHFIRRHYLQRGRIFSVNSLRQLLEKVL